MVWSGRRLRLCQARERHLPLEGENQDQLDADDARYRDAWGAEGRGYVAAEHHSQCADARRECQSASQMHNPGVSKGCMRLRRAGRCDYDRSSMIGFHANGKLPSAIIRPFAIVAPHAR